MHQTLIKIKLHLLYTSILTVLILIIFFQPLYSKIILFSGISDYEAHLEVAKSMVAKHSLVNAHFIYHFFLIFIHQLFPTLTFNSAALLTSLLFYVFLGLSIYFSIQYIWLLSNLSNSLPSALLASTHSSLFITLITTLALMLVMPIGLLTYPYLYRGYIGINVYHNPTITALKPLAVLLFLCVVELLSDSSNNIRTITLSSAILTVLSTLAKPSYTICLLPAIVVFLVYKFLRRKPIKYLPLLLGVIIPGFMVLVWQFNSVFIAEPQSRIVFAPFQVYLCRNNWNWLLPKFLLSIAFPLAVYLCYFRVWSKCMYINFSWLTFLFAVLYKYFLAESGKRMCHGNFGWSSQICLLILFLISTTFFLNKFNPQQSLNIFYWEINKKNIFCLGLFGLHIISGLIYYKQQVLYIR